MVLVVVGGGGTKEGTIVGWGENKEAVVSKLFWTLTHVVLIAPGKQ